MYIRESKTKNPKTGTVYISHQLVETIQTEKGPRNNVLLYLGRLTLPKSSFKVLAEALENRLNNRKTLFPPEPEIQAVVEEAIRSNKPENRPISGRKAAPKPTGTPVISPESVEASELRTLGPELVGHQAWERLGGDDILIASGFSPRERALAEAVVMARLVSPGSELHTHRWITGRSAIGDLLGQEIQTVGKDAVYEIGDRLWGIKDSLETALFLKAQENFPADRLVFLYDLTNTYLEGSAMGNTLAKRGHSKEKRTDCPLIGLSLVVDHRGFAIQSHVAPGNQSEPETLPAVLDRLKALPSSPLFPGKPTLIMDRGIATRENIALLRERNIPYCIVSRRAAEKNHARMFRQARETFTWFAPHPKTPEEGVFLHKCSPENGTVQLLVLSDAQKAKEESMDTLKETRFIEELAEIRSRIAQGGAAAQMERISRRLGRLEGRYPSIAKYYKVTVHPEPAPIPEPSGTPEGKVRRKKPKAPSPVLAARIEWEKKPGRETRKQTTGTYVIETTHIDLSETEIWSLYMTLTQVEEGFRSLKTDLGLRPVYHQTAERTRSHLFLSVLAYHLLSDIEYRMREKEDCRRWSSLRETLSTHMRLCITGQDPHTRIEHALRLSSQPEPEHQKIYALLGIKDPTTRIRTKKTPKEVTLPPSS
jgi:transposase